MSKKAVIALMSKKGLQYVLKSGKFDKEYKKLASEKLKHMKPTPRKKPKTRKVAAFKGWY